MAPSANRRTGYSRRAQYGTFFGYVAGIAGALVGVALLLVSIIDPGAFAWLRGGAADVAAPVGRASAAGRSGAQGLITAVQGYFAAGSQNRHLRSELSEARVRLAEAAAVAEENRRLKALLDLARDDPPAVTAARLIASSASSTRRFATISAGSGKGVTVGMPVRSPLGVLGRVLEVSGSTSRVLLLTDSESVVPARRSTDGVAAFAQGRGDGSLQLRLISLGVNPLKPGDVFVTSGSGGLYRPGMAFAQVISLTRDGAIARLLSDPAATEYVAVEPIWLPPPLRHANPGRCP